MMSEKKNEEVRTTFDFLKDWGDGLTRWTERWIPDALVIVIILSLVTYVMALIWGFKPETSLGTRAFESVKAWGNGFWVLLEFAVPDHDDRLHPGLFPSCAKTHGWNLRLVQP
jgi:hypothetical protein